MNTNYITYTFGSYLTITLSEEEIHNELTLLKNHYSDVLPVLFSHIKKSYIYAFLGYKLCVYRYGGVYKTSDNTLVEWLQSDLYTKLNSFSYDYYENGEFSHSFSEKLCLGSEYCHVPVIDVLISGLSKRTRATSEKVSGGVCSQIVKINDGSSIENAILYEYSISFMDYFEHLTNPTPKTFGGQANVWDKAVPMCFISDSSSNDSNSMCIDLKHSYTLHKELILKHNVLCILIKYPSNLPRPANCCS